MIEITRAGTSLDQALRLQLQRLSESDRASGIRQLLKTSEKPTVSLDDCLVCRRGNRIDGVLLLVGQADGTVYVWPAETRGGLHPDDDFTIRRRLYQEAAHVVDSPANWIGQSLLETDQHEQSLEFSDHGFPKLTDLIFMSYTVESTADGSSFNDTSPEQIWSSEPFDKANNEVEFAELVERTYQQTCDCPELNGARNGFESMESHRQAGTYCPSRWRLFRHEGRPAGLLLMSEHSPEPVWEIVYFGVAPEFRGRGFGKRILKAGIHLARTNGVKELVLAVDVRNAPAIRLYERLKFSQFDRRIVHARIHDRGVSNSQPAAQLKAQPNR